MSGRDRILEVAEELFLEKGFRGTSMLEVAERAGVAKSLIYHHFESKQALWEAMIRRYHESSGIIAKLYECLSGPPESLLEMIAGERGFFGFLRDNPGLVRLMAWLDLDREFTPSFPDREMRMKVLERLRQLRDEGHIRAGVRVEVLPVMVISIMMHWFRAKWMMSGWLGSDLSDDELDRIFLDGFLGVLIGGISPAENG